MILMNQNITIHKKDLISFRSFLKDDENFIYSTWLRGLYYGNDWFHEIDKDAYFENYEPIIKAIVNKATTDIKIACLKESPEVTLGYCVSEGAAVHYIFCKEIWRGIGLMRDLLPKDFHTVTHLTKAGLGIIRRKFPHVIFNPFFKGVTYVR